MGAKPVGSMPMLLTTLFCLYSRQWATCFLELWNHIRVVEIEIKQTFPYFFLTSLADRELICKVTYVTITIF